MKDFDYVNIYLIKEGSFSIVEKHSFFDKNEYVLTFEDKEVLEIKRVQITVNSDLLTDGRFQIQHCDDDEMIIDVTEPYNSH